MLNCGVCQLIVNDKSNAATGFVIKCQLCVNRFHGKCVGISTNFFYNLVRNSWKCYNCLCSSNSFKFVSKLVGRIEDLHEDSNINKENSEVIDKKTDGSPLIKKSGIILIKFRSLFFDKKLGNVVFKLVKEIYGFDDNHEMGNLLLLNHQNFKEGDSVETVGMKEIHKLIESWTSRKAALQ